MYVNLLLSSFLTPADSSFRNNAPQLLNIGELIYAPAILFIKLALLLQYFSVLVPDRTLAPFVFYSICVLMGLCTIFYTVDLLVTILACWPREMIWNKLYPGGWCVNYHAMILATCIWNVLSDVAILVLPLRTVWKLKFVPVKKKVGASLVFATGLL
jgi:hypothetical protein